MQNAFKHWLFVGSLSAFRHGLLWKHVSPFPRSNETGHSPHLYGSTAEFSVTFLSSVHRLLWKQGVPLLNKAYL